MEVWKEMCSGCQIFPDFRRKQALVARRLQTILPTPVLTADRQTACTSNRDLLLRQLVEKVCNQRAVIELWYITQAGRMTAAATTADLLTQKIQLVVPPRIPCTYSSSSIRGPWHQESVRTADASA